MMKSIESINLAETVSYFIHDFIKNCISTKLFTMSSNAADSMMASNKKCETSLMELFNYEEWGKI